MSISWPVTTNFPQYFLVGTVSGGPRDINVRTQVAQGDDRVRARYDVADEEWTGVLLFPTQASFNDFVTFYKTTLSNGSEKFDWYHPGTLAAATCQFLGSYNDSHQVNGIHRVTVKIKVFG